MTAMLTTSSQMMCPHGGTVSAVSSNTRVSAAGSYLLRPSDTFTIAGCPINIAGAPHPCIQVDWVQPAARSSAAGDATLNAQSVGLCVAADQAVQGTVLIIATQARVSGL